MSLLIIADKTVGPITDFHNLVTALAEDKVVYVMSNRATRARFITQHFTQNGFDVRNMCSADNTIDSQIDRITPQLDGVDSLLVAGSLCANTVLGVASIIDAFLAVDRTVLSYEV